MNDQQVQEEVSPVSKPPGRWLKAGLILLGIFTGVGLTYAWLEHRSAQQLAASRDELRASLSQTRTQVDALTAKLNALNSASVAAPASIPDSTAVSHTPEKPRQRVGKRASAKRPPAQPLEDPRWNQVQAELADHEKQIAESQRQIQAAQGDLQKTRSELEGNLKSTRDELSGSIARNHEELLALERKGERNYYEFDLRKSKLFRPAGSIGISLRKATLKHQYCDLEMIVNDSQLTKKHVNLYEPVLFYPEGYAQPLELVINRIGKDSVQGYVSEPKYKPEGAANSAQAGGPGPSQSQAATEVSLQHRSEPQR